MAQPIVRLRRGIDRVLAPPTGALRGVLRRPMVRAVLIALLLIILFGFPIVDKDPLSQSIDTASAAEVFVLLALGLNVVVGFAGLLDLGYAAFFAIGAYTMALLASSHFTIIGHSASNPFFNFGPGGIHVNFFLMIPVAALAAALCGVIFGAPTLRLRGDYLAIVTLGFGEIVPKVIQNLGPNNSVGLPNITNGVNRITGIDTPPNINILGLHWTWQTANPRPWYYLGLVVILFSVVVIYSLKHSRLGRAWAAIREDEIAAAHMGINITRTRLLAFSLGAAFSGFGGLIEASRISSIDYTQFQFNISITILVMVILGGIGSIPGAALGALILSFLDLQWLAQINSQIQAWGKSLQTAPSVVGAFGAWMHNLNLSTARPLIYGLILLLIMLLRPQGLWPAATRARELRPETAQVLAEEDTELYTVRQE